MILLLLVPLASAEPVVTGVQPVSSRHLAVDLPSTSSFTLSPSDWTLRSTDDAAFSGGRSPVAVDVRTRAAALETDTWPYTAVPEHQVLLAFDTALTPGATYTLDGAGTSLSLDFDPDAVWSPAIKVNQVGWRPDAPGKHAYVHYWLADLPALAIAEGERGYRVVDAASGATVHEGTLTLRLAAGQGTEDAYGANYSNADVWDADLSALTAPGEYYVVWEGVGRSWTFRVGDDVYDDPFRTVFRALYHQRCGVALEAAYTDYPHAACHTAPVHLTTADYHVVGADAFDALPAADGGVTIAATGGYHDAGDYDRRIDSHIVVDALIDLYELDPERFAWDDAGIPESGNGVPDVIDEAAWALGLYAQLQGGSGGVRAGVETTGYPPFDAMPEDDDETTWYAYAEDPISSYRFAGAAAKLARVRPDDGWLARAEAAWAWAEANPRSYDVAPWAAYAAAELLKTTGDAGYDAAFQARSPFATSGLGWRLADWDGTEWVAPLYAYATADAATSDVREAARAVLIARADAWIARAEGTGFRLVKHPYAGMGLGVGTTPTEAGLLLRVHRLTGDVDYLAWATWSADGTLGANQTGWSWVTGVGDRPVRGVLQTPSIADGIAEPVPGLTVYGPHNATSASGSLGSVLAAYDPPVAQWPVAERYADVIYAPAINEFTVQESIATTAFVFGLLAELAPDEGPGDTDADDTDAYDTDDDTDADDTDADGAREGCGCAGTSGGGLGWLLVIVAYRSRARPSRQPHIVSDSQNAGASNEPVTTRPSSRRSS